MKMAATMQPRMSFSRMLRSITGWWGAFAAPNRKRWANDSMYSAPSTTPVTAPALNRSGSVTPCWYCGHVALNAPRRTRNSPVNPLVVGSPIDASVSTAKNTAYAGSSFARPPYAASSRVWQRS